MKTSTLEEVFAASRPTAPGTVIEESATREMQRRIAALRAGIEDEDGAGELPMAVYYVVNGDD
jgi:hypothetical protein